MARWLIDVGPRPALEFHLFGGGDIRIRPERLDDALRAQRRTDARHCRITAISGPLVRAVNFSYHSAHVSLVAGTTDRLDFDWQTSLDTVLTGLRSLEPVTRSAFVRHTTSAAEAAFGAHAYRQLFKIASRQNMTIERERTLEQSGLVDAQGIVFLPASPDPLPAGWTGQPFGHLHRIDAPDPDAWLAAPPTDETIRAGRASLQSLLQEALL